MAITAGGVAKTAAFVAAGMTLSIGFAAATGGLGGTTVSTLVDLGRDSLASNMSDMASVIEP